MIDNLPQPPRPTVVANILALEPFKAPVCLHGPPGVGKTELIKQIGETLGYEVRVIHLNQMDPSDVKGYFVPDESTGRMIQYPPKAYPPCATTPEGLNHPKTILFFDEWGTAQELVRKPAMEVLQARSLADYRLAPQHWVLLATNTGEDGVMHEEMDSATADRMCHLYVKADLDDWLADHAVEADIDPRIQLFLQHNTDAFHFMRKQERSGRPDKSGALDEEYTVRPTPRSWTNVSRLIRHQERLSGLTAAITGYVGTEEATRFIEFTERTQATIDVAKLLATKGERRTKMLASKSQTELATLGMLLPAEAGESIDRAFECCDIAHRLTENGRGGSGRNTAAEMADFIYHRLARRLMGPIGDAHRLRNDRRENIQANGHGAGRPEHETISSQMAKQRSHPLYPAYLRCISTLGPMAIPNDIGAAERQRYKDTFAGDVDERAQAMEGKATRAQTTTSVLAATKSALQAASEAAGVAG